MTIGYIIDKSEALSMRKELRLIQVAMTTITMNNRMFDSWVPTTIVTNSAQEHGSDQSNE